MNEHVTNPMQNIMMSVAVIKSVGSDVTSVGSGGTTSVEGLQDTRYHTWREHMNQAVLALNVVSSCSIVRITEEYFLTHSLPGLFF